MAHIHITYSHIYLIYLINSKNTYFESHIAKAKFIQNIIIYLILIIIPNTKAYQRSQYHIEHKSRMFDSLGERIETKEFI